MDGKATNRTIGDGDMGLKIVIMVKDLGCLAELPPEVQHLIHDRY